jgi:hypothetical protein
VIVAPLLLQDAQDLVIRRHHARHKFCNVFRVKILEVNLDVGLKIKKLFIVILRQLRSVKLLEEDYRALQQVRVLEARTR